MSETSQLTAEPTTQPATKTPAFQWTNGAIEVLVLLGHRVQIRLLGDWLIRQGAGRSVRMYRARMVERERAPSGNALRLDWQWL